jgi:hypothetical protein
VVGNRGANGIDGFVSTVAGVAAGNGEDAPPVVALCGDMQRMPGFVAHHEISFGGLGQPLRIRRSQPVHQLGQPAVPVEQERLTRDDPVADPGVLAPGLEYARMHDDQQELVQQIIQIYIGRAPIDIANSYWRDIVDAGLDSIAFRWAGSDQRGEGHYYALNGPTFLIEYDNTQDDANHAHSVWRHLRDDWGGDLLRAHYERGHAVER